MVHFLGEWTCVQIVIPGLSLHCSELQLTIVFLTISSLRNLWNNILFDVDRVRLSILRDGCQESSLGPNDDYVTETHSVPFENDLILYLIFFPVFPPIPSQNFPWVPRAVPPDHPTLYQTCKQIGQDTTNH